MIDEARLELIESIVRDGENVTPGRVLDLVNEIRRLRVENETLQTKLDIAHREIGQRWKDGVGKLLGKP